MRSLFVKIGSGFTVLMLLLIGAFSLYFYTHDRRLLLDYAQTALVYEIEQRVERFREDIDAAKKDVLFLSSAHPVQGIVRTIENDGVDPLSTKNLGQWRGELASLFIQIIGKHKRYSQIRFLGGMDRYREIVRVDQEENSAPEVASVEMLQDKHNRDYVQETLQTPLGRVYTSKINLNREHNQISQPHTPTIRLATQVHYFGVPFGMVVINIDLRHDLADISSPFPWTSRFYLVDEKGDYLAHPDPAKTFGSDLGHDVNLKTEKPLAWKALARMEPDAGQALTGEMETTGDAILFTGWFQVGGAWPQRWIGVAVEVEKSAIFGNLDRGYVYLLFAAPIAFCIGTLLIWGLSRRFARPLADLSAAMNAYGKGEPVGELPVDSKDETGQIARSFEVMRERIDDRTNELERLKNRLETLLDFVPVGIFETDARGDCLYVNKTWWTYAGLTAEQAMGEGWMAALHPEDKEAVLAEWFSPTEEKRDARLQFRFLTPDGDVIWLLGSVIPNRYKSGRIIGYFGVVQDITDLKAVEDALRESEARFRGLVENSSDWIWEADVSGRYTYCSPGAKAILGYETSEILGKRFSDLMDEPNRKHFKDRFSEILKSNDPFSYLENEVRREDGQVVVLESRGAPIINENGKRTGYRGIDRDITQRKRAEEELRQSEERFKGAFHNSPIGIALISPEGRFLQVNSKLCDKLGYPEKELLAMSFQDLTHPDDLETDLAQVRQVLAGDIDSYTMEKRYIHNNGQVIWAMLSVGLVRGHDGRPLHFISQIKDISDLKQAAENLDRQKNMLQGLLEAIEESAFLMDAETRILFANQTVASRLGVTAEALIGKRGIDFLPEAIRRSRMEKIQTVIETRKPIQFEDVRFGRHVDNRVYPLIDSESGEVSELAVLAMDITERKKAELERNKLWRAVENSPLCIVITDTHGIVEYVNPAFSEITGYSFEEAVGKNPRILQSGKHDAAFYADLWQTIAAGKTWRGEMCNRQKNGDLLWEQVAISPVKNEDGQVVNYVAVKQDISDRKNLERLKEDVDRIMRHDLKTPLNAIIGIPQILEMEDDLTEEQREYIGMIKTAGRRMVEMIDMSLNIYKMESGAYRCEPAPVDVKSVVHRIMDETRSHASAKNVTIRFEDESGERPVMVLAEKLLLLTMLSNLVINALEASPSGESVAIAAKERDDGVEIAVHNMGAVPEAVRKDFFQKYTTHGKKKGTGLGAYSAKLIAESMHGRIRMDTSETTGTVVSVVLPIA